MKRYEKYKDCGLGWIEMIPSEWEIISLKYIAEICNGSTPKDEDKYWDGNIKWLTPSDLGKNSGNKYINDSRRTITEVGLNSCGCNLVPSNSIILSTRAPIGHVAIPKFEFATNQGCKSIVPSTIISSDFLYYFIIALRKELEYLGSGSTFMELSSQSLADFKVLVPSFNEQLQIASYLDHKTTLIDELISKKQHKIELLKEQRTAIINQAVTKGLNPSVEIKDSHDVNLGDIPIHWEISKLKYITNVNGRIGYKGYTKDDIVNEGEGALTLGAKHIDTNNKLNLSDPEYISWDKYYESPEIMIKINDVIFTQRGSLGKVCHIDREIGPATINPSMVILTNTKINSKYLYYWLIASRIQNEVSLLQANTAVPMISQFQLSSFPILIPPREEQDQIVTYLEKQLIIFSQIHESQTQIIELLLEYRQSLISEVVTGKIDVRDFVSPIK